MAKRSEICASTSVDAAILLVIVNLTKTCITAFLWSDLYLGAETIFRNTLQNLKKISESEVKQRCICLDIIIHFTHQVSKPPTEKSKLNITFLNSKKLKGKKTLLA